MSYTPSGPGLVIVTTPALEAAIMSWAPSLFPLRDCPAPERAHLPFSDFGDYVRPAKLDLLQERPRGPTYRVPKCYGRQTLSLHRHGPPPD